MEVIQFKKSLFTTVCRRKHLIVDQEYHLYVFETELIMTQRPQDQSAKYRVELDLRRVVHFLMKEHQIQAFGLQLADQFKWFHARHEDLNQLRSILSNKVMFSHVLDFYEPKRVIGSGVSSQVYLIQDLSSNTEWASKCIPKAFLQEERDSKLELQVTTLTNEISILRRLDHPQILKMLEVFEGQNTFYLIFELLQGPTLSRLIRQNAEALDVEDIRIITTRLLEAIAHIHAQGFIHRDIKPENIMFKNPNDLNSLKIIDFGFATEGDLETFMYPKCGTPGYVAPEVINLTDLQKRYSNKCDLFSVGVILYKLFTKQNLFPGQNTEAILRMNKKCFLNLSLLSMYKVPKAAHDLIVKLLQPDPIHRISAEEALLHPFILGTDNVPSKTDLSLDNLQGFDQIEDESVITQIMPVSLKPNFKSGPDFGSFVMKSDIGAKLTLKVNGNQGQKVFSPQVPKQLDTDSAAKQKTVTNSAGTSKKKSAFVFFQQQQNSEIAEASDENP